ncbi:hypothetical protein CBR_g28002 [Chara braunii]|uniref:Uncharacterized protein n=1 Tax=Chara braunii TaxID=69332 RepID=A0A388L920_CHABU|nr:hypothetical protein CBR_g28002 [Chara braunii]|eukprot:GBG78778.1 hypothetical protein CBR_g28002 [Chara braunii]
MNHRLSEHEPLEHFHTPLADRLLRHQFNEERQLRYDIQQVNVPASGVADLATYSLLCDRLTYAGVYVDVTQLLGRETTRVFIEFPAPRWHLTSCIASPPLSETDDSAAAELGAGAKLCARIRGAGSEISGQSARTGRTPIHSPRSVVTQGRGRTNCDDVEPLPFADEDSWELHRAVYKSVALGMFRFFVDHEDHSIGEHFVVYYVITRPKPAQKEGMVALYPFAQLQTTDLGLLELIHLELLSIAQVIASEEEEIQPRLRTAAAPRRTYNAVVIPDYIAQREERLEDFPEEKPL